MSMTLIGGKEMEAKLASLERNVGKKVVRVAVRDAQKALPTYIKMGLMGISKGGGMAQKIAAAITVRAPRRQKKGSYTINVQFKDVPGLAYYPKGSSTSLTRGKTTGERAYIPAAIEYGHGMTKEASARPFMRPAADATIGLRMKILSKGLADGIGKIWMSKGGKAVTG